MVVVCFYLIKDLCLWCRVLGLIGGGGIFWFLSFASTAVAGRSRNDKVGGWIPCYFHSTNTLTA